MDHLIKTWSSVRGILEHGLRRFRGSWARCTAWPGERYADAYVRRGWNRQLHRLGFGPVTQLRLLPSKLEATCGLLRQPYRVPLSRIRWGGRPSGGESRRGSRGTGAGVVFDGDWDLSDRRPIGEYLADYIYSRAVLDFLRDGVPYSQTAQYREMMALVRSDQPHEWQARGCSSEADVNRYFETMRHTFEQIRRDGYRSQAELGSINAYDEIKVFVDREGQIHKQQGAGHHRLAMARILNVPSVPVIVVGVHREFALRCFERYRQDILTSIDLGLQTISAAGLVTQQESLVPDESAVTPN